MVYIYICIFGSHTLKYSFSQGAEKVFTQQFGMKYQLYYAVEFFFNKPNLGIWKISPGQKTVEKNALRFLHQYVHLRSCPNTRRVANVNGALL